MSISNVYLLKVEKYLNKIEELHFNSLSNETWETIQDEGIDEELDLYDKKFYKESFLILDNEDKENLIKFNKDTIEMFNLFDIKLKEKYNLKYIDFINYELGSIKIILINK